MKERVVKEKLLFDFNNELSSYDIPDNYGKVYKKLKDVGVSFGINKQRKVYRLAYVMVTFVLCLLTGVAGYFINNINNNEDEYFPTAIFYLEENATSFYSEPLHILVYSQKDFIGIFVGINESGEVLYFCVENTYHNNLIIKFRNITKGIEVQSLEKQSNLSALLSIESNDEIECIIEGEGQIISNTFFADNDFYIKLIKIK